MKTKSFVLSLGIVVILSLTLASCKQSTSSGTDYSSTSGNNSGANNGSGNGANNSSEYGTVEIVNNTNAHAITGDIVFARLYISIMDVMPNSPSWHQLGYSPQGKYTYSNLESGTYTLEWKIGNSSTINRYSVSVGAGGKRTVDINGTSAEAK